MAIYKKDSAIGIDLEINRIIDKLNTKLNVDNNWDISIYHRIYRNIVDGKIVPQVHVSGIDYKEVFLNDTENVIAFILSKNRDAVDLISTDVDIVFSLRLDDLTSSTQREDEKAILTAMQAIEYSGYETKSIKTDLDNIFSGFAWERYKHRDMWPWLNFIITVNINYKNTIGCNVL